MLQRIAEPECTEETPAQAVCICNRNGTGPESFINDRNDSATAVKVANVGKCSQWGTGCCVDGYALRSSQGHRLRVNALVEHDGRRQELGFLLWALDRMFDRARLTRI